MPVLHSKHILKEVVATQDYFVVDVSSMLTCSPATQILRRRSQLNQLMVLLVVLFEEGQALILFSERYLYDTL